jgi:hypothetical protein
MSFSETGHSRLAEIVFQRRPAQAKIMEGELKATIKHQRDKQIKFAYLAGS